MGGGKTTTDLSICQYPKAPFQLYEVSASHQKIQSQESDPSAIQ